MPVTEEPEEESEEDSSEEEDNRAPPPSRYGFQGDDEYVRVRTPNKAKGEMYGIADQLLGASRIKVLGGDGKARMGRIPGKLRKRMWIRQGDLLIIKPWEFQPDKADIIWRYTKTQAISLSKKKLLPEVINVF